MNGPGLSLLILVLLAVWGIAQERRHLRNLARIPVRVHVNGTRGKSSVTRLIAAGLRAGGLDTIGKTTGTKPRFIYSDGREVPVVRPGHANIIEQLRIVRRASELGARVLVTECMGIKPELQSLLEDRMIRSTHSVITNCRADHLDEMGPTVRDVARNLARTISREGQFFTAERTHLDLLCEAAARRGSRVHASLSESISADALQRFSYYEHAENVALALAVCASLGVDPDTALAGMSAAQPDPGALRIFRLTFYGREITFVNAFAMNDPDSYRLVWKELCGRTSPDTVRMLIVNCRRDRMQRSEQLGELVAQLDDVDHFLVTGEGTAAVVMKARRLGVPPECIEDLEGRSAAFIFERVLHRGKDSAMVTFGVGNIVGLGEEIVDYFSNRGEEIVYRSTA